MTEPLLTIVEMALLYCCVCAALFLIYLRHQKWEEPPATAQNLMILGLLSSRMNVKPSLLTVLLLFSVAGPFLVYTELLTWHLVVVLEISIVLLLVVTRELKRMINRITPSPEFEAQNPPIPPRSAVLSDKRMTLLKIGVALIAVFLGGNALYHMKMLLSSSAPPEKEILITATSLVGSALCTGLLKSLPILREMLSSPSRDEVKPRVSKFKGKK